MGGHHHHHHHHPLPSREDRYGDTRTVTLVGALVNLLLAVLKVVFGYLGQSQALIADGVHSLSDLLSDGLVLFAAKHAAQEADEEHPYGHGRFETVATVALGVILLLVGLGISWDAVTRLLEPESLLRPGWLALGAALVSILAKEGLYQYTMVVARRVRSDLLRANAWHHRTDAISSVVVVVGVAGVMAGLPILDALAAIGVALMVGKIGWDLAHSGVSELVDTALDPEMVERLRDTILGVDGVGDLHLLKTRRMGSEALVDVHILLENPRLSVSEGHQISETVRHHLIKEFDDVSDVMVHIDPEDDEVVAPCRHLPLRGPLMERLRPLWDATPCGPLVRDAQLHYLDGKVHVELVADLPGAGGEPDPEQCRRALTEAVARDPDVGEVRVLFR